MKPIFPNLFRSVWSATPTPLTDDWRIDCPSVHRLVEHHVRLGVKGLFLAGSCGEGAWMPERERRTLLREAVDAAEGRLGIAMQVTDNSAARILDNIAQAREDGADLAVIAPPYFLMNATPANLQKLYLEAIRSSELPVCLYDLGARRTHSPAIELLAELYAEPNVVAIKDSSGDTARRAVALAARDKRPDLRLLAGDEFRCVEYLQAGYDGLMLGGAAFHGYLSRMLLEAVALGEIERANQLQTRMKRIMYAVYGGEKIECWLAGEKKMLMELGIFETYNNYLNYSLTPECLQAIETILEIERDSLLPYDQNGFRDDEESHLAVATGVV